MAVSASTLILEDASTHEPKLVLAPSKLRWIEDFKWVSTNVFQTDRRILQGTLKNGQVICYSVAELSSPSPSSFAIFTAFCMDDLLLCLLTGKKKLYARNPKREGGIVGRRNFLVRICQLGQLPERRRNPKPHKKGGAGNQSEPDCVG